LYAELAEQLHGRKVNQLVGVPSNNKKITTGYQQIRKDDISKPLFIESSDPFTGIRLIVVVVEEHEAAKKDEGACPDPEKDIHPVIEVVDGRG